jgi:hypothetical protein
MLQRGYLAWRQFKPSFAHKKSDLNLYDEAIGEVFNVIANLKPDQILESPAAHTGFTRLTKE